MKPVVLIPGFGGSVLVKHGREHRMLLNKRVHDNRWVNIYSFTKSELRRWKDDNAFHFIRDEDGSILGVEPKNRIETYDFGGTQGIKDIVPEFVFLPHQYQASLEDLFHHRYMRKICDTLYRQGYKDHESLFGAPYDFRFILDPTVRAVFFSKLRVLIETAAYNRGEKVVVVSHSLGGIMFKWFCSEFVSQEWVDKHIATWVCMSAPFGGSYQALRAATSGEHYVPALRDWVKHEIQRNHGVIACFPNQLAFDADEPLWFLDGKQISLGDYGTLAERGIVPFQIWDDLLSSHLRKGLQKPLSIPTELIYVHQKGGRKTQGVASSEKWDKAPFYMMATEGDGVVPLKSLRSAEKIINPRKLRETVLYETDHAALMNHDSVLRIITEAATGCRLFRQ